MAKNISISPSCNCVFGNSNAIAQSKDVREINIKSSHSFYLDCVPPAIPLLKSNAELIVCEDNDTVIKSVD